VGISAADRPVHDHMAAPCAPDACEPAQWGSHGWNDDEWLLRTTLLDQCDRVFLRAGNDIKILLERGMDEEAKQLCGAFTKFVECLKADDRDARVCKKEYEDETNTITWSREEAYAQHAVKLQRLARQAHAAAAAARARQAARRAAHAAAAAASAPLAASTLPLPPPSLVRAAASTTTPPKGRPTKPRCVVM